MQYAAVVAELPGHRDGQAPGRRDRPWPGIGQEEGPRAVRALGFPGRQAVLPDQGRLLIDTETGHRQGRAEGVRAADLLRTADHVRLVGRVHAEGGAGPLRPGAPARSRSMVREAVVTSVT